MIFGKIQTSRCKTALHYKARSMEQDPTQLPPGKPSEPIEPKDGNVGSGATTGAGNGKKLKKKQNKKAIDPKKLTPEYIEEQRRLRNLKKEQKRQELLAQGIDPEQAEIPEALRYKTREFVNINSDTNEESFKVKIMTYNVLAQALIRRKLFPTSGNALKWATRSQILLAEMKHYDADILCLQELDYIQYNSFWKSELSKLGYNSKFHRGGSKNHGVCIFYKESLFVFKHQSFIEYDKEESGDVPARTITQNVGLLACFEFTPQVLSKYKNLTKNGLIIGTTHLFWHPFGTFERNRQTYIILKKCQEFIHTMNVLKHNDNDWYTFFAGDFNSQPFDSPYLSITAKPVKYNSRGKIVLSCSLSFQYSKNRGLKDVPVDEDESEEEGGNIEKFGKDQPRDPVPDEFDPTEEQLELVTKMEKLHNELEMRAISLYSVGYNKVDPKNSGVDNERNEPMYSNWAHAWRGLLDYIFVITKWNKDTDQDYSNKIDLIPEVSKDQNITLLKLLRLPRSEEMGEEPSGQPRLGQYPSDHFCLMAEVALH